VVARTLAGRRRRPSLDRFAMAKQPGSASLGAADMACSWLQPHRVRQFKLSNDPQFAAKLHEIVGLYVDPPDHAIVLSSMRRAKFSLDRTQPGLPMKKGRAGTMTHDYERHGVNHLVRGARCP